MDQKDSDKLYKMELHETIHPSNMNCEIIRVPGGWIYRFFTRAVSFGSEMRRSENYIADSVFVPFKSKSGE